MKKRTNNIWMSLAIGSLVIASLGLVSCTSDCKTGKCEGSESSKPQPSLHDLPNLIRLPF